uniref:Uncharacterized protein n=1 Tax=Meloidogyne enterolobii TaxID=390850 RepID=A0A6V7UB41_MELEN|nr:unnamed protein product [Meloidogyne enterolobii]
MEEAIKSRIKNFHLFRKENQIKSFCSTLPSSILCRKSSQRGIYCFIFVSKKKTRC